jgi:4-hydroxy-tetrahydrodipicolinate reductase
MVRVGILGCAGRMGRMLIAEALSSDGLVLAGGTEVAGSPAIGRDLGELAGRERLGIAAGDDPSALMAACDVAVDFTRPAAMIDHARLAQDSGTALVVGTTGLGPDALLALDEAAKTIPVLRAANMSVGITVIEDVVRRMTKSLGPAYDIEIVEMHHRHKIDAPSGTALALGRAAAAGRGVELESVWRLSREGDAGPRKPGEIGFAALRGGGVIGEHKVIFASESERIEIGHVASSRQLFASGAMRAALWLAGRKPGLYSVSDVLESD